MTSRGISNGSPQVIASVLTLLALLEGRVLRRNRQLKVFDKCGVTIDRFLFIFVDVCLLLMYFTSSCLYNRAI